MLCRLKTHGLYNKYFRKHISYTWKAKLLALRVTRFPEKELFVVGYKKLPVISDTIHPSCEAATANQNIFDF